jgi:hypothetical protein
MTHQPVVIRPGRAITRSSTGRARIERRVRSFDYCRSCAPERNRSHFAIKAAKPRRRLFEVFGWRRSLQAEVADLRRDGGSTWTSNARQVSASAAQDALCAAAEPKKGDGRIAGGD